MRGGQVDQQRYDIAIIGSGIGGSILATILSKEGVRVVVIEESQHPKFAIGESMILESSEIFRQLAETYDIPEIAYYSSENFKSLVGSTHGIKRHFSYMYHKKDQEENPGELMMANIPKEPYGHEMHIYRQDCDYFYCALAIKYGATVIQNAKIQDLEIDHSGVELKLANGRTIHSSYVVDASGFRSILANKYKLRKYDLETHSRAIFTHAVNVPSFHKVANTQEEYGIPYSLHEGTLHHVFEGGWLWIIPFDNHKDTTNDFCSIGLLLDPRVYPERSELSAEEEFFEFILKFPGINKQLKNCKSVRDWTRTGRIQYSTKKVIGERFCLLGHAAGFIDPLFSKGLYITLTSIHTLAPQIIKSVKENNFETARYQNYEDTVFRFIEANDKLIARAYKSFTDFRVWRKFVVLWVLGAYLEYLKLTLLRFKAHYSDNKRDMYSDDSEIDLRLVGGGFEKFNELEKKVYEILDSINFEDTQDVKEKSQHIFSILLKSEWIPFAIRRYFVENHLNSNQFNLAFLKNKGGILGTTEYRRHFFGELPTLWLLREFFYEKYRYSAANLKKKKFNAYEKFDRFVHIGETV